MRLRRLLRPCLVVFLLWTAVSAAAADEPAIDFNRDIRAVLSDKCFFCHGPDGGQRKADLRLDRHDELVERGVIVAGDPDASELVYRIESDDPDMVMPPPETNKSVTPKEAELIRTWVEQGGTFEQHWAFVPPRHRPLPQVESNSWVQNPLDRFVLAKLESSGLQPSPPADPTALVRRLYLDLTGLPPSPAEVDSYLEDPDPAKLVDELLGSPHFGEKWARWWLDAARYADSDGYEKDKPRNVWFYRDWVITALNRDLPYDDFIVQQIAGDLLPGAGQWEHVATGFLRNSMTNEEGGADPEQFRVEAMFDRMDAIGKAILGITTQCAQCHSHKYDPLTQQEYYRMYASLDNFHEGSIPVFTPQQDQRRREILERVQRAEEQLKSEMPDWQQRLDTWARQRREQLIDWKTLVPSDIPYEGQKYRVLEDGSILSESFAPTKSNSTFAFELEAGNVTAIRLDVLTHPQLPRGGPGRSIYGTGALSEFEATVAPKNAPEKTRRVKFVRALSDLNPPRQRLKKAFRGKDEKNDKRVTGPAGYAIDGDKKTAWTTSTDPGRRHRDRHLIFVPEQPIETSQGVILSLTMRQLHGGWNADDNQNNLLGRYRFSVTGANEITNTTTPLDVEKALRIQDDERSSRDIERLFSYWISTAPEFSPVQEEIDTLWSSFPETDSQLVAIAKQRPSDNFVFKRGNFLDPGDAVTAGTPAFLHPLPRSDGPDRLRFARWLASDDSPTTARAIVNRIWQSYFGRGLVATPEDFGFQSPPPTHRGLLDWLAIELMENGWSLKHVHRLITTSATYQQTSRMTPALRERDPSNTLLARGPRFRVDAESVRDIALEVSGLLEDRVGGRSIYPPAPEFLFQPPASYGPKVWRRSRGGDEYRRSLYVHRYRSVPYPVLRVFDAPKGDAACVQRERSNTPLQALVVLNEPQFVDAARAMAERVVREAGPSAAERIDYAHRLCVARRPTGNESQILHDLYQQQRERIQSGDIDVAKLLGMDPEESIRLVGAHADEVAAWMVVCRALLNLDETITKP